MKQLLAGVQHFRSTVFAGQRALFERLADGQAPSTLFITCSDSRIDPQLLTQTGPGNLFVLRNAGNLVPAFVGEANAESAAIEFAVAGLGVSDVIVCGHSHCGAVKALLEPEYAKGLPSLQRWLRYAEATRRIVDENYPTLEGEERVRVAVAENVLVQVENLQTHPAVAARVAAGKLAIHAWVYVIETGEVLAYERDSQSFGPVEQVRVPANERRLVDFDL